MIKNSFLVLACLFASTYGSLQAELSIENISAAQERYERNARIRTWVSHVAFGAKIAMDTATFYRLLAPLWWQPVAQDAMMPKKMGWLQWGKASLQETLVDARNLAVSLVVNKLASPLLHKLKEQVAVPVASSWFLAMRGNVGTVVVSHEYAQFVAELETMDVALRTLLMYEGQDAAYQQTILKNFCSLMERSLGYLYYQGARLQAHDMLASLTVKQVADKLLALTNEIGEKSLSKELVSEFRLNWQEQCALLRTVSGF